MPWNKDGTRKTSNIYMKSSGFKMKGSPARKETDAEFIARANKQKENAITNLMKKGGTRKQATTEYLRNIKK